MQDKPFEQLAAEAASGLKSDRELYLDVKEELRSHIEDKAERFLKDGKGEEESVELAKKWFGSPLDVAAELLAANRGRMKFRALLRITFGALVVPLAIVLALYVGYGRFARQYAMQSFFTGANVRHELPTLPFFQLDMGNGAHKSGIIKKLGNSAESIHSYWEAHKNEPDSYMYYAYYATHLDVTDKNYAADMQLGEKIEPQNALYNWLLAGYYLNEGITAKAEKPKKQSQTDDVMDRQAINLGIAELRKAIKKPYLRDYALEVARIKVNSLPTPLFTEDYMKRVAIKAAELFPYFARYRATARKIPGVARVLLAEGNLGEAEEVMDTWKQLMKLLSSDTDVTLIYALVVNAIGAEMTMEAPAIYEQLGENAKAKEANGIYQRLMGVKTEFRNAPNQGVSKEQLRQHGSRLSVVLFPVFGGALPTDAELLPGRMYDHAMTEQVAVEILLVLFVISLLGVLLQGAAWLFRLRRASAIPMLLLPPAHEVLRALLLGVILPIAVYAIYSRLPIVGGREFGWASSMWPRFAAELILFSGIIFYLPGHFIRKYIRRRCDDLGIVMPDIKTEKKLRRLTGYLLIAAFFVAVTGVYFVKASLVDDLILVKTLALLVAFGCCILLLLHASRKRQQYGLYFGTIVRSMAPIYAFTIILLSFTVQPWLLYNEIRWLRADKVGMGYIGQINNDSRGFTLAEDRAVQRFSGLLQKALEGK